MHMTPLRIFVGFDTVESAAYHTLCHSITTHSSVPVSITPINSANLRDIYTRPRDPKQSNAFSFTRFLVPYLCDNLGWALFMDCDMLVRFDIKELFDRHEDDKAVMVCQHDYTPRSSRKYLGNIQYRYPRKNWSSVMLLNCAHWNTRRLTPAFVNSAPGLDLHRFTWADDHRIGRLPLEYNWLVGEYNYNPNAKIIHWTEGGPWFPEYYDSDYGDEWRLAHMAMNHITLEETSGVA